MGTSLDRFETENYGLCHGVRDHVHIELGDNGFSVCRSDQARIGDCLIEGIPDLGVATELTELLIGELEQKALEAQEKPGLVFG
ncbi:MAG: hypothetical protein HQM00_10705 [Magnetococcales bacterium]|nr:hypothetical protein [Magnetococcales bacterium]